MKLAYITRDESIRSYNKKEQWSLRQLKNEYFLQVIKILDENLYAETTSNYYEIHHNLIIYNQLSNAYLMLGGSTNHKRKYYDFKAIYYLLLGLKIDKNNSQLIYTLGHPGVKKNLKQFGIVYFHPTEEVINNFLTIENKILDEINNSGSPKD